MVIETFTDFGNEESRRSYLIEKFDDLLQGVNNMYGQELMEELLTRMEKTISIFHNDIQSLIKNLKKDRTITSKKGISVQTESKKASLEMASHISENDKEELSEWERRLLDRQKEK